jgi:hypothetical protein
VVEDIASFDENNVSKAELLHLTLPRSQHFGVFARLHRPKVRCRCEFAYCTA